MKTYSAWTDQPGLERRKSKRATNKIMIVALAALILCFTWAKSGLAAQPQKPPASTAPVFTLFDSNGKQVGTVFYVDETQVTTLLPIQDSTGVTRKVGLDFYPTGVRSGGGTLYFESANCSGTPFIESFYFSPAFDGFFLLSDGTLAIVTSDVPQTIRAHSYYNGSCGQTDVTRNLPPGEFVGNINNMFPPPYTLIVK